MKVGWGGRCACPEQLKALPELPGDIDLCLLGQKHVKDYVTSSCKGVGGNCMYLSLPSYWRRQGRKRLEMQCPPTDRVKHNAQQNWMSHFFLAFPFRIAKSWATSIEEVATSWNLNVINMVSGHGMSHNSQKLRLIILHGKCHLLCKSLPQEGSNIIAFWLYAGYCTYCFKHAVLLNTPKLGGRHR